MESESWGKIYSLEDNTTRGKYIAWIGLNPPGNEYEIVSPVIADLASLLREKGVEVVFRFRETRDRTREIESLRELVRK